MAQNRRAEIPSPQPPSFLPARTFGFLLRQRRSNQSGFCSKKVRASFSNCDQPKHCEFCGQLVCSLAPPEFIRPTGGESNQLSLIFKMSNLVGDARLELATSCSQSTRATNCANPRKCDCDLPTTPSYCDAILTVCQ